MKEIRAEKLKNVLWVFVAIGFGVAVARFIRGLGATTALTDFTPWGFWIGFDVLGAIALSGGGFVFAAIVYIFHLKRYHTLGRTAVVLAFLGYGVWYFLGLLCDIGLPWRFWHPILPSNWQIHSPLFEVAMCVMAYLTILSLEFTPMVLGHKIFHYKFFQVIARLLHSLVVPIVIVGVVLSTLHQSSLGSLFLIMPLRLHPLWYTPILPLLFFITAVGVGMMAVTFAHLAYAYFYEKKPRMDVLDGIGKTAAIVLSLYFLIRMIDIITRGKLPLMFDGTTASYLFLSEIGWSAVIPVVLLLIAHVRKNPTGLFLCSVLVTTGLVFYRLNVSFIAVKQPEGFTYIPSWMEIAISVGLVSFCAIVFMFLIENLRIYETEQKPEVKPREKPEIEPTSRTWLGDPRWCYTHFRSFIFVAALAGTVAILPASAIRGFETKPTPVKPALRGWDVLTINGNRNDKYVNFYHDMHKEILAEIYSEGAESCRVCHHMGKSSEGPTDCSECHSDMYLETSIFDHVFHEAAIKKTQKDNCIVCHATGESKTGETAVSCVLCHSEMFPELSTKEKPDYSAPGYYDAMHGVCIDCHKSIKDEIDEPNLDLCITCHKTPPDD